MSVRTRSSARRNSDTNSQGDEESATSAQRPRSVPAPPPPPPPPPPPMLSPVQEVMRGDEIQKAGPRRESMIPPWTLKVRAEPTGSGRRRDVVRIYVTARMRSETLAECIQQTCDMESSDFRDSTVAGLFRESDCLFLSLGDILAERDQANVYSLSFPYFPKPKPKPWWTEPSTILLVTIGILLGIWRLGPMTITNIQYWSVSLFELVINQPLRELYRYGPSIVGWDGASLPSICARITYHGDEAFWRRNMDECLEIYSSKEESMLRTLRPMCYLVTIALAFIALRSLVREHARVMRERNQAPFPPDHRDMVDTYHALNVIFRLMSRSLNDKQHHHYHNQQQQQRHHHNQI